MAVTPDNQPAIITRVGQLIPVLNQNPQLNADERYYATSLTLPNGRQLELLFTSEQISDAMVRRQHNPEDVPEVKEPSFWERIFK